MNTATGARHVYPSATAEEAAIIERYMEQFRTATRNSTEAAPRRAITQEEQARVIGALSRANAPQWFVDEAVQHNGFEGRDTSKVSETAVGAFYLRIAHGEQRWEKKSWLNRLFPSTIGKGLRAYSRSGALLLRLTAQGAEPLGPLREATLDNTGGRSAPYWIVIRSVQLDGVRRPGVIVSGPEPTDARFDAFYYYEVPGL